ncbi:MAG: RNA polymerase sigma factor [Phycisphaerae bacterium]
MGDLANPLIDAKASTHATRAPVAPSRPPPTDPRTDFDTQLMLQVQQGDREAANMLIRRNFERVARYIGRVVRDSRQVEDLTQETLVQVLANAGRFQPIARFSTWLYRVATNTALKYLTQSSVRSVVRTDDKLEKRDLADRADAGPEQQCGLEELKSRVSDAINELPHNQRIALTLCEYEELSYEQIASVLNVSVEGVRCLLQRARTTLRTRLAGLV